MRWTFEQLLTHASRSASVRAGEVLTSGTCRHGSLAGARPASGRREPSPLKPGDVVEMTIEGIGTIRNRISRPADTRDLVTSEREHPA
jgi:2-keto-4-pentenoate hydratase/2-oxohepta-3-ene-1,7-dioic acid hydratase in catechol pathway